jgi:hypothetical protein
MQSQPASAQERWEQSKAKSTHVCHLERQTTELQDLFDHCTKDLERQRNDIRALQHHASNKHRQLVAYANAGNAHGAAQKRAEIADLRQQLQHLRTQHSHQQIRSHGIEQRAACLRARQAMARNATDANVIDERRQQHAQAEDALRRLRDTEATFRQQELNIVHLAHRLHTIIAQMDRSPNPAVLFDGVLDEPQTGGEAAGAAALGAGTQPVAAQDPYGEEQQALRLAAQASSAAQSLASSEQELKVTADQIARLTADVTRQMENRLAEAEAKHQAALTALRKELAASQAAEAKCRERLRTRQTEQERKQREEAWVFNGYMFTPSPQRTFAAPGQDLYFVRLTQTPMNIAQILQSILNSYDFNGVREYFRRSSGADVKISDIEAALPRFAALPGPGSTTSMYPTVSRDTFFERLSDLLHTHFVLVFPAQKTMQVYGKPLATPLGWKSYSRMLFLLPEGVDQSEFYVLKPVLGPRTAPIFFPISLGQTPQAQAQPQAQVQAQPRGRPPPIPISP